MASPILLATARAAAGWTQSNLAERVNLSQSRLSKIESGAVDLDPETADRIAGVLNLPAELLRESLSDDPVHVFHRKRSSLPVSKANQLRAQLEVAEMQSARILNGANTVRLRRRPLDGMTLPAEVARETRRDLGIEPGPLDSVVGALEAAGAVVLVTDFGTDLIDALMTWPLERIPTLLVGDHAPGDRRRFSMAHELGHAVMHSVPTTDQESQADQFASEFLMPASDIRDELTNVDLPMLAALKSRWGTSMSSLLRRAYDLGTISDSRYRSLNIEMSAAGYRTSEPVRTPVESPAALRAAAQARVAGGASPDELARQALMTTSAIHRLLEEHS